MFALSLGIGWWVAGRALRPVGAIIRAAEEITATDLSRRIAADGPPDELHRLADTIDGMLERLDGAFRAERMLVEDVSHELRNPVAVVQSNVEAVLADDFTEPSERHAAATVVLQSTRRMSRLLEDLLASARARSGAFTDRVVDIARLAEQTAEEYRSTAQDRRIVIRRRIAAGPVAFADPDALARAVGNVLSNAVRLAPAGSTITVGVGSVRGGRGSVSPTRGRGSRRRTVRACSTASTVVRTRRTGEAAAGSAWRSPGRSSRATMAASVWRAEAVPVPRSSSGHPNVPWTASPGG
ncbi:HAMP domain-containing sensor histidine kinase [Curtobacterium sp. 20TX0008]|nr:HAMP domain-containing sensor histidine kinase [Curtobacterium sp. 20TX0008]MDB6427091.1 HAMP domain-containing sensor histidine kinase [Curtobacterium sp. 20TX0008]